MATTAATVDRDNPWPGLASYDEAAQVYFSGRAAETTELTRRIADEAVTVLFGKSGLGKSSLLKAGVFPGLRQRGLLPVPVRLHFGVDAPDPIEQMAAALFAAFDTEEIEYPPRAAGETLWDYLHRAGLRFWTPKVRPVQPVLVLDQFEEVFTLGRSAGAEALRERLSDLGENRIPAELTARVEAGDALSASLDVHAQPYKLVLSLREDFLPDLESWVTAMPALRRNRMRLLPMQLDQARQAVHNAHTEHLVDAALADRIVDYLASGAAAPEADGQAADNATVEPALLSLVCRGINESRKREGKARFDDELFDAGKGRIVADFYRESLADQPDGLRAFIEDELVTDQGYRNSYSVVQAVASGKATRAQIVLLVERRLLRVEHQLGTERVELTHDLLTVPVLAGRTARAEVRWRRTRRKWFVALVGMAAVAALMGLQWRDAEKAREVADQAAARAEAHEKTAHSREVAARAEAQMTLDRELAVLLGTEALRIADTPEARAALLNAARYAWPTTVLTPGQLGGTPRLAGLDARGRQLAVVAKESGKVTLSLWDLDTRAPKKARWQHVLDADSVGFVTFIPTDSDRLLVARPGRIEELNARTGIPEAQPVALPRDAESDPPKQLAVSTDGHWLAAVMPSGAVLVRDRRYPGGSWETAVKEGADGISISDDGRRIAVVEYPHIAVFDREPTGRWSRRKLNLAACAKVQSVSPAASYAVATWRAQACSQSLDPGAKVDQTPTPDGEPAIEDTVPSAYGPAFVAILPGGELKVGTGDPSHPDSSSKIKGVPMTTRGNMLSNVSVNGTGTRVAWLSRKGVHIASLAGYKLLMAEYPEGMVDTEDGVRIVQARAGRDGARVWMTKIAAVSEPRELPRREWRLDDAPLPRLPERLEVHGNTVVIAVHQAQGLVTTVYDLDNGKVRAGPYAETSAVGHDGGLLLGHTRGDAQGPAEIQLVRLADGRVLSRWPKPDGHRVLPSAARTALLVVGPSGNDPNSIVAQAYALRDAQLVPVGRVVDLPTSARARVGIDDAATVVSEGRVMDVPGPAGVKRERVQLRWPLFPGSETSARDPAKGQTLPAPEPPPATPAGEKSLRERFVWRQAPASGGMSAAELVRRDGGRDTVIHRHTTDELPEASFSGDERWFAYVEGGVLHVLDLESRRPVLNWPIDATDIRFTRGGNLLRVELKNDAALLVPMDRALLDGFARWLVSRELTQDERCKHGVDICDAQGVPMPERKTAEASGRR